MPVSAFRRAILGLVLGAAACHAASAAGAIDPQVTETAREARRAVAIIDGFYVDHHACPQPSRPAELKELQGALGDGFSAEPQGQFVSISGISMTSGNWRYYASSRSPDRCTLWRRVSGDLVLIWRRSRSGANWALNPGDGTPERPFKLAP